MDSSFAILLSKRFLLAVRDIFQLVLAFVHFFVGAFKDLEEAFVVIRVIIGKAAGNNDGTVFKIFFYLKIKGFKSDS